MEDSPIGYTRFAVIGAGPSGIGLGATLKRWYAHRPDVDVNDILIFETDLNTEVIARLPYGTAGPPYLTTQSEVATLDYLRNHLHLPVPRILAWDASAIQVGCEFVVYEKLPGEPVSGLLYAMFDSPPEEFGGKPRLSVARIIEQHAQFSSKLAQPRP